MAIKEGNECLKTYFKTLQRFEPLDKKTERKLLKRYKQHNDLDARNKLLQANLRYACQLAMSYEGAGFNFDDLISEANLSLIDSIDKYDMKYDVKLISYAKWWITERLNKKITNRKKKNDVELPSDSKWTEAEENEDEINFEPKKNYRDKAFEIEDEYDDKEETDKVLLSSLMSGLSEREEDMVNMYYGRNYNETYTLEEIGQKHNLTKERVRQIIEMAFKKLRSQAILYDNVYLSR